jgi:threonine/homoserine/homoserine lactone efflux protein
VLGLLIKIIPLDFAATLSPGILALALILLGSAQHPKGRTISFFLGTLLVGIGIALLGFFLGQMAPVETKQNVTSAVVDLILGAFFVFFGVRTLYAKERKIKENQTDQGVQALKWILIGIAVSITNFDALFLSFTAAKEIGGTGGIDSVEKLILILLNLVFFTLPVLLPLVLYFLLPKLAARLLEKVNHFVLKYSKYIMFALFIIFGIYLLVRGLKYL